MKIDLGTCQFTLPDDTPFAPLQFVARGIRDEAEPLSTGMMTMAKVKKQGYSRFFSLTVQETPEGMSETQGLDHACQIIAQGYKAQELKAADFPTPKGIGRLLSFRWVGPNAVPLRGMALVQVYQIVARSCFYAWLDAPKVNPQAEKQFASIVESLDPEPRVVC